MSFIIFFVMASAMKLSDTPSLMEIEGFPLHNGRTKDLMMDIAEDSEFMTCILQDTNGNKIKGIRLAVKLAGGDVSDEVFNWWLNGKGKWPVTWQTLVDCLEVAQLMTLVGVIKKEMEKPGSSPDSLESAPVSGGSTSKESTSPVIIYCGIAAILIGIGLIIKQLKKEATRRAIGEMGATSKQLTEVGGAVGKGATLMCRQVREVYGHDEYELSHILDILETIDDSQLGRSAIEDDLADVLNALSSLTAKWRTISTNIRLKDGAMDIIEANNGGNVHSCLHRAITEWLKLNYDYDTNGLPSWRMLAKAVYHLDRTVFNNIVKDHPATQRPVGEKGAVPEVDSADTAVANADTHPVGSTCIIQKVDGGHISENSPTQRQVGEKGAVPEVNSADTAVTNAGTHPWGSTCIEQRADGGNISEISHILETIDDSDLGSDFNNGLADVCTALSGLASQWQMIAINLQLTGATVAIIKREHLDPTRCLINAITKWLDNSSHPSWRMLAGAVYNLDRNTFNKIVKDHPNRNSDDSRESVPTVPKMIHLSLTDGSKFNLTQRIGTNYRSFGILLLNDQTGARMNAIRTEHGGNVQEINLEVFRLWINGEGRRPVSWETLITVLEDIDLNYLADKIKLNIFHH